jgi:hypothetical protein
LKIVRHYSAVFALLSLVLFYSLPLKSLHDCNNLIHHHDYTTFETAHDDCAICDHSYNTFDFQTKRIIPFTQLSFELNNTVILDNVIKEKSSIDFNKGPPTKA